MDDDLDRNLINKMTILIDDNIQKSTNHKIMLNNLLWKKKDYETYYRGEEKQFYYKSI